MIPEHTRRLTVAFRAYLAMRGRVGDGAELTGVGAGTTAYRGRAVVASDADVRAVLATPAGAACVATGLALNSSGWFWMRRIVGGRR